MEKQYFFLKLNPPRPTFPGDITAEEKIIMKAHSEYWRGLMEKGIVHVFGPVTEPDKTYGIGVIEAAGPGEVEKFIIDDPVTAGHLGKYEYHPIRAILPGRK